jgi:hypothetical protein
MPDQNLPAVTPKNASLEVGALAKDYPVIHPDTQEELRRLMQINIGPRGLSEKSLEVVKVPTGAALMWSVPGIDGDEAFKVLTGIILGFSDGRVYWRTPYSERGKQRKPPDCSSKDGLWGRGDPGGQCEDCPLSQFGSDPKGGRGQACKQQRRILLLRKDRILPEVINVPPTSIKSAEQYFLRLFNQRIPYWGLISSLSLERTSNADGIDYARIVFSGGPRLSEAERAALAPYQAQMSALLRELEVDVTDYSAAADTGAAGTGGDTDAPF